MNGQYYVEYQGVFGMLNTPVMSETAWKKVIAWLGRYVEELALATCEQVRTKIVERGDKFTWKASFDGFYLTRGHHSNNCSATLHDVSSDKIAWYAHRTKRGPGANWHGTSSGAEGDMLQELLESVKMKGFTIQQIVMDHDTSGGNIACGSFPEVQITYCGNHTAKSFHHDLTKLKSIKYKCSPPCKSRVTEDFIKRAKKSLRQIMANRDVVSAEDPLKAFSEALLNFHSHYCKDDHSSKWCQYHPKELSDGSPYSTTKPVKCKEQSDAFLDLLKDMAKRPHEYVTPEGRVTTNSVEGFHGLALKYRGKRVDLTHSHYVCKTNMAICHKNLGPLWKVICLWIMGVDVPQSAVATIIKEHTKWQKLQHHRSTPRYHKYKSQLKERAHKRHEQERNHMATLQAVGITVSHYTGHSVTDENDSGTPVEQLADTEDIPCSLPEDAIDPPPDDAELLLFLYDCETTGGSFHNDHIMEIASMVVVPDNVNVTKPDFTSLCHTSRHIVQKDTILRVSQQYAQAMMFDLCNLDRREGTSPTSKRSSILIVVWLEWRADMD